jgi:hypothetical protein
MGECEVCRGRNGAPEGTVTFALDAMRDKTSVRACLACIGTMADAMVTQWNDSIEADNHEVQAMCDMLGIEFPAAQPS